MTMDAEIWQDSVMPIEKGFKLVSVADDNTYGIYILDSPNRNT